MDSPQEVALNSLAQQAYCEAFARHRDLDLNAERYANYLLFVTKKHLGASLSEVTALAFINRLHINDLYLSVACAKPSEAAWQRFTILYRVFIENVAVAVCSNADAAREVADSIPGHLFLPGASGRSRIASYEGRSSLAAWLSAVVNNKAIAEQRRCKNLEQLENLPEIADYAVVHRIEAASRAGTFASLIRDSLIAAGNSLSERERSMLTLRYEDGLEGSEIAEILGVHPSTVGRHLQQIYEKLQARTVSTLASKHQLQRSAVQECLDDIRENLNYSILTWVKADG